MRYPMLLAGIAILLVVAVSMLAEEGEVVTLETTDEVGQVYQTRLWVVELDDGLYVRGPLERPWVERLRLRPQVTLTRAGTTTSFRATAIPDPPLVRALNRAMAEKYGGVEHFVDRVFNRGQLVAIRLDPVRP